MAGKTPFEAAWVDAIADQGKDFQKEFRGFWNIKLGYGEGDVVIFFPSMITLIYIM